MKPSKILVVILALAAALAAVLPTGAAARRQHARRPRIRTEEVGYFGTALVTRSVSVFVYTSTGPAAGTRVTVCLGGHCERAKGHNARLSWYQANFSTRSLRMGDPVSFSATATNAAGRARVRVTKGLLCMHNNGSTPQTS